MQLLSMGIMGADMPEKEKTKHVYIPESLHRRLKIYAASHGLTISGTIETLLDGVLPKESNGKKVGRPKKEPRLSSLVKYFGTEKMANDFLND